MLELLFFIWNNAPQVDQVVLFSLIAVKTLPIKTFEQKKTDNKLEIMHSGCAILNQTSLFSITITYFCSVCLSF